VSEEEKIKESVRESYAKVAKAGNWYGNGIRVKVKMPKPILQIVWCKGGLLMVTECEFLNIYNEFYQKINQ
jgi:hypothetical protein